MMGRGIVQKKGIQSLVRDEIVHIHAIYQDKVRVNENQIQFVYHQGELLYEKGGEESSYHLGGGLEAVWRSEETHYYHQDEQLSMAFITNEKREIQNHYQYDVFGNGICQEEGISNRIHYTGQQFDGVTGQYYLRARYYNPIVGRFLQEDVYQGDGLNLYAYCGNNPMRYYDPSGYSKTPEVYNMGCPGATTNGDVSEVESDVNSRNINGQRTSKYKILTPEEIASLKLDIEALEADLSIFRFNEGFQTGYSDKSGLIY